MKRWIFLLLLIPCGLILLSLGVPKAEAKNRTNLYTPEEIKAARDRRNKELWAKEQYDSIIKAANKFLSFTDDYLRSLIASSAVPRAFDIHFSQCPIHSEEIKKYGSYPWIIDLNVPWKVKCPVGGEYYPSNDFDPENPGTPEDVTDEEYIDTGWGWRKPGDPQKYWFVAYFNHWAIHGHIVPGAETLGKAYLLTGDKKYSHKAAVILDRLAEVYPEMNHQEQSRFGTEIQAGRYPGRIVNYIWETGLVSTAARAYDYIYEGLEGDRELEESLGKSIAQIKENIETNLLEDAARSIYTMDGRIRGNYGMHQRALATLAVVLDNENSDKYIDWVLFNPGEGGGYTDQGMASGLINLLYRDGIGFESSPGYNFGWIGSFVQVAEILLRRGVNVYEEYPRMKSMFDVPIAIVMNDNFTPNIGDSGNVLAKGKVGWAASTYETAFRRYGDPKYAKVLYQLGSYGQDIFKDSIKNQVEDVIKKEGTKIEYRSDNLSGYGLALLRGGKSSDPLGVSLYYGKGGGHDHWARLNMEVFGRGIRLVPDLGYPEFMSGYHKKLYGWTGHTLSHTTVMVDESRQQTRLTGWLYHFASLPGIQYADVSAEDAYSNLVDRYRRSVALLDTLDGENAYVLDIFRVKGGSKHDYSIHGPRGEFSVEGISLPPVQTKGTLAGEDIPFGTLYDDPVMKNPAFTGPYSGYRGSGFGYLFNVQKAKGQDIWSATWDLKDGMKSRLKMTFLGEDNQVVIAEGEPPRKGDIPRSLKYILRRREGSESTFVTLIEPYRDKPFIKGAQIIESHETAVALRVDYEDKRDYIIQDIEPSYLRSFQGGITTQAGFARLSVDDEGQVIGAALVAGNLLEKDGFRLSIDKGYSGQVESIDYHKRRIIVKMGDDSAPLPTNGALMGKSLIFSNEYRLSEYEIGEIISLGDSRYDLELKGSDFLSGYGRVKESKSFSKYLIVTADRDLFKREYYRGMYLANSDGSQSGLIIRAESTGNAFLVDSNEPFILKENEEFYIYDFGVGSRFTIDTVVSLQREMEEEKKGLLGLFSRSNDEPRWHLVTTSSIELKLPREIECLDSKGQWVRLDGVSKEGFYVYTIDVSLFEGGQGYFRYVKK